MNRNSESEKGRISKNDKMLKNGNRNIKNGNTYNQGNLNLKSGKGPRILENFSSNFGMTLDFGHPYYHPKTFYPDDHYCPWQIKNYHQEGGLAEEIEDFVQWVSPTAEERKMRQDLFMRISSVVQDLWPQAKMEVIGSYKTELCIPMSDIDLVILGVSKEATNLQPLFLLSAALEDKRISRGKVKVLTTAKVPIIKFKDYKSGCGVDIAFEISTGLENTKVVESFLNEFPLLRPLTLIIKYFLKQWGMNDTWSGGIGSYTLVMIITSYLQKQTKLNGKKTDETETLGDLFLGFFEFYGRKFDYEENVISVKDCCYYNKKSKNWLNEQYPKLLSVEDPFCPEIDVGNASFQIELAKQAFEEVHFQLSNALKSKQSQTSNGETENPEDQPHSFLSVILQNPFTYYVLQLRSRLKKIYGDENNFPPFSPRNSYRKPYNGKFQKNRRYPKNYFDENKNKEDYKQPRKLDMDDFPSLPFSDSDHKFKSGFAGHYGLPTKTENAWTIYQTRDKVKWPTANETDRQN